MSSIGESVGAELYTAEMIKPPLRYRAVALIGLAGVIGMVVSLIVARLVLSIGISWRIVFWIGALIALVGSFGKNNVTRITEFSDAKRKMQNAIKNSKEEGLENIAKLFSPTNKYLDEKVCKKTSLAYFMVFCGWPFCFYFSYVHCGGILKNQFDYTKEAVINQNLIVLQ